MAAYYYMMSSLPSLSLGARVPFSWNGFLSMCKGNVSGSDYQALSQLTLENAGNSCRFSTEWTAFYGKFSSLLANVRARRHSVTQEGAPETDLAISSCVNQAVNLAYGETGIGKPLEAELFMLDFLIKSVDRMVGLAQFDQNALFGYAVKLLLLLRKDEFSAMEGKAEYRKLFSNMQSVIFDTSTELE